MTNRMYTTKDKFSWWIVTDMAHKIFETDSIPLYVIYEDESESLIESIEELQEAINLNLPIAMELGYIKEDKPRKRQIFNKTLPSFKMVSTNFYINRA